MLELHWGMGLRRGERSLGNRAPIGTVRFELYIIRFDLFGSNLNKSSIRSNLLKFDSNRNCNRTLVT
jgi:hypothetical protein